MRSISRLTIADLRADPSLLRRLVDEGETLYVERKERDPKDGLGATVASFANTLGGWLLLGVTNDHRVVGYTPKGRTDLQDYIRDLLRSQVDPMPPFVADVVPHPDGDVGVVRVFESSDQPHVTYKGEIYRRNPGGKEPVKSARDIIEMARKGEDARRRAEEERLYQLPLIGYAMVKPDRLPGERQGRQVPPFMFWTVRAAPLTVTGAFADRALSPAAVSLVKTTIKSLFPYPSEPPPPEIETAAFARGFGCTATQASVAMQADMAVDSGGVVAVRDTVRRDDNSQALDSLAEEPLKKLLTAAVAVLAGLDACGRVALGLDIRGVHGMRLHTGDHRGVLRDHALGPQHTLYVGGDIALPASDEDIDEVIDRWKREIGRAAGIGLWEPDTQDEA